MCMKFTPINLNSDSYPLHSTNTYTCGVIIAPRVCGILRISYYWMLNESLSKLINKPPKRQNTLLIMERTTKTAEKKTKTNMAGYIYIYNIILWYALTHLFHKVSSVLRSREVYSLVFFYLPAYLFVERENSRPITSWHIILPSPQNIANYKVPRVTTRFCYHYSETNRNLLSVMQEPIMHQHV